MITENDKRKSAQQVIEYVRSEFNTTFPRPIGADEIDVVVGLIDAYPPGEPDIPGVPCEHGFDDNFWCYECRQVNHAQTK